MPQISTKASNAASASFLVSAIQISCSARLAFGCWLFGSLLSTLAVDRKSTRLNSSHVAISYAVFCLKKKKKKLLKQWLHFTPAQDVIDSDPCRFLLSR